MSAAPAPPAQPAPDYAARDAGGRFAVLGLLVKKPALTLDQFDRYWRDAHGMIVSRFPGVHQNWLHQVARSAGAVWPRLPGIEYDCPPEDQLDGVSEATFASAADKQRFMTNPDLDLLMADEQNLFAHTILHAMAEGDSRTLVDRLPNGAPNGGVGGERAVKVFAFVRRRPETDAGAFRRYLADVFAPSLAASPHVAKVRLHLLGAYANDYPPAAVNVAHDKAPERQYQAALEVAFPDRLAMARLFAEPGYAEAARGLPDCASAVHTFPVRDTYALVHGGRLTLAGQRTSPVARLIEELGALNQTQDRVVALTVRGPKAAAE